MKAYNKLSEISEYESIGLDMINNEDHCLDDAYSWWEWMGERIKNASNPGQELMDIMDSTIGRWIPGIDNSVRREGIRPEVLAECYDARLSNADYIYCNGLAHYYGVWSYDLSLFIDEHTTDDEFIEYFNNNNDEGEKIFKSNDGLFFNSEDIEDDSEAERFAIGYQFGINPNTLDYDDGFDRWTDGDKYFNVSEEDRFKDSIEIQFGDYCLYVTDVSKYINQTIDRSHLNEVMDKALSNYKVADGELKGLPVEITMFSSFRNWQDYKENEHDVRVDDGEIPADSEIHNSIFEYYDYLMESDEGLDEFIEELAEKIDAVVYTNYDNIYIYKHK